MKKKITADLTSLAHRILQLKKKEDINELLALSRELHERLTVLAFAQEHFAEIKPTAGLKEIEEKLEEVTTARNEDKNVIDTAESEAEMAFQDPNLSKLFISSQEDDREEMDLPGIATIHKMVEEMPDEEENADEIHTLDSSENRAPSTEETQPNEPIPDPDRFHKNDMENIAQDFQTMPIFQRKDEEKETARADHNEEKAVSEKSNDSEKNPSDIKSRNRGAGKL